LDAAVDGWLTPENGWSLKEGTQFQEQFAVFACDQPLTASLCQVQLSFLAPDSVSHFGDFEVNVTTDPKPSIRGLWKPLVPESVFANFPEGVLVWGSVIRIQTFQPGTVVTLRAQTPFGGITGFRLRLLASPGRGSTEHLNSVGRSPDGNFRLTEFQIEADPLHTSNIAFGRQLFSSGAVPAELPLRNLTDGFNSTYTYQTKSWMKDQFFFELDLGRTIALHHIVVRGRADGTVADQLSNYRVELLTDPGGYPPVVQWQARIRADGSRPAVGSADILAALDGSGTFSGRLLRIHNNAPQEQKLQLAELEVYPALQPRARDWLADGVALNPGSEVVVPPSIHKLAFTIFSEAEGVIPGALLYRWRVPGWVDQWRETDPDGRVVLCPPPPTGAFHLHLQARHSDGLWDGTGYPVPLRVALPWWRDARLLTSLAGGVAVVSATLWWRLYAWRMKRRLALAQQTLELHRERLRIARDMHDEMGARLTYIALLADRTGRENEVSPKERAGLLETLAANARSAVDALDTIVWAVNPQHDTVAGVADYLSDYAPGYLKAAGIECSLDISLAEPEHALPLLARHELLMAVKEALQNVVKHAAANKVRVTVRQEKTGLEISVRDDGHGEPAKPDASCHHGLANMRQRLSEIGGHCEILVANGSGGTCVRFTLPLPAQS